jgi:peroxiredoxin (alkyl hydroperoxide reductase subunit C)
MDENSQEVRLSGLRGAPVVLVFYPADFSPVCSDELCGYRDDYSGFEAKGARVFGISRDSVWAHKAFKESLGLKHSLLADMKGAVSRLYGTWNEDMGLAERLTVVVDGDGIIRYVTRSELLKPRDHKEALAALG